jgi:hypothetical protein
MEIFGGDLMNSAKQVNELAENLKKSGIPLSDAVWETALACVGFPYVFGAWGEECTPANRKRRYRDDHPTIKTACQVLNGSRGSCLNCKWYPDGERVWMFDCRGFTDKMLKLFGIDLYGDGCTQQWNHEANWEAKGTIDTVPDDLIVCLFVKKGSKMEHTGFGYKGQTCECSSGVQHFTKRDKKWTHWAIPAGIGGDMPDYRPTLRRGDKGDYVKLAQNDLMKLGFALPKFGADGDFGRETENAVKEMQKQNGLVVDGIIGQRSWEVLKKAEGQPQPVTTLYTVHIPHCTKYQAEGLINQYPGATMTQEG